MKKIDLTNQKFGRLTVISEAGRSKCGQILWMCRCDCGNIKIIQGGHLKSWHTKSCGCLSPELSKIRFVTHGKSGTPEYRIWTDMLQRCANKRHKQYKNYGGRGITVCARWLKFVKFINDMGKRPNKKLTLERIDNDKGYHIDNCVWATRTQQNRNRRICSANTSGTAGIWWHEKRQKWVVGIGANRKQIHIGRFVDIKDAVTARKLAEEKYWNV